MSLNQPLEVLHQENSRSNNNRHFDKQHRRCSYHRGSHQSDRLHPMHHPIDLSSRTDTPVDEINLLSKRQSFCPIPRGINWYKCRQDWQAFVDKMRWADFHFDREHIDTINTSDTVVDLDPFKVKSHTRAPVSKERPNQGISCGTYLKFERQDSITKPENP